MLGDADRQTKLGSEGRMELIDKAGAVPVRSAERKLAYRRGGDPRTRHCPHRSRAAR